MSDHSTARKVRTIWLLCSNCKVEWVAREARSLEPGKFVVNADRWRAACPECGVHTVGVWMDLVPRERLKGE